MKLSVIIPFYNAYKYITELLNVLTPQITEDVEVLLIDDGSEKPFTSSLPWLKVVHQDHGGVSRARNRGLTEATGDYIAFIDADDLVKADYVSNVLHEIDGDPDYIELSWKSLTAEGLQFNCKATNVQKLLNPSVCTRVFKRSFIDGIRFNENKDAGEDADFTRRLPLKDGKRAFIGQYMYFYRTTAEDSAVKRFKRGLKKTKQIVYYIPEVKADRTDLLEEIRKANQVNEVYLMTNRNEIPELEKYCNVIKPRAIWAHEARGEHYSYIEIIQPPIRTQVLIYIDQTSGHDGIYTFIFNFCQYLKDYYDIAVLYYNMPTISVNRLRSIVRVINAKDNTQVSCDTLLMMRLANEIPTGISYNQVFQLVHCTKSADRQLKRPVKDCVFVSETSRKSFTDGKEGHVIYNLNNLVDPERVLMFVSTSRIGARDKGNQDVNMLKLAEIMNRQGLKFVWFYFSDTALHGAPENLIRLNPVSDVRGFLQKADYLIHLSENEAYCYSIAEAISIGVPVIAFNLPVLKELGFKNKKHGYLLPEDLDIDAAQFLKVPRVKACHITDDIESVNKWVSLLGSTVPTHDYIPEKMVTVKVNQVYKDMELNKVLSPGTIIEVTESRAAYLINLNLAELRRV